MTKQKQKIWNKIKKALKLAGYVFVLLIVVSVVLNKFNLMNLTAFAANTEADMADKMGFWAEVFQKAIWPIVIIIGGLMDNSLLFAKGMEQTLLDIWVPVRNMVNIIVVVVMVGIALYNVLGIGGDEGSYTIKKMLPNLIIGIIAINFSFVGIKVFLDAINVMTTAIFALPAETMKTDMQAEMAKYSEDICQGYSGLSGTEIKDIPGEGTEKMKAIWEFGKQKRRATFLAQSHQGLCKGNDEYKTQADGLNACANAKQGEIKGCIEKAIESAKKCEEFKKNIEGIEENFKDSEAGLVCKEGGILNDNFFKKYGSHNAALVLAVTMGQVMNFKYTDIKTATDIKNMAIGTVFSVLMYIVYVISFIALGIVLMGRIVVLWISIALSPIILLLMFVPTVKEKAGGLKKITDEFVRNAIAPLIIAIPLSVGFIMLSAVKNNVSGGASELTGLSTSTGIPVAGMNTLESLIAMCGTLALIWIGVFEAAENTIAGSVTGAIKGFGQKIGGYILQKPLEHFPLAPIKGLEGQNLNLRDVVSAMSHARLPGEGVATAGANALLNKMGLSANVGSNNISDLARQTDASQMIGTLAQAGHIGDGDQTQRDATRDQLRAIQGSDKYKNLIAEIARRTGRNEEEIKSRLDTFISNNGKQDTVLAGWIQNAYNANSGTGSGATPKKATPGQVNKAKTAVSEEMRNTGSTIVKAIVANNGTVNNGRVNLPTITDANKTAWQGIFRDMIKLAREKAENGQLSRADLVAMYGESVVKQMETNLETDFNTLLTQ